MLPEGTHVGTYEILAPLGAGGMGEVYRARDSRLKREVAIKILPDEFSRDHDRVSRFQREAEVLASLNHPNIAAIHELHEANNSRFLILELVEGETLAERVARGALPLDDVLNIGKQISEGLEAAHEKGIVHRDLKPANVKVLPDGTVKILDFGLAKPMEGGRASAALSNSPTLSMAATQAGVILGTAAYMPPEQAKGKTVDRRADIWAFGVVLYEMLTGRRLFDGETASEVMASVMMKEPDWSALPDGIPLRLQDLLRRCLIKDPRHRLRDIGDARVLIEEIQTRPDIAPSVLPQAAPRREWLWISISAVLAVVAVVLGTLVLRPAPDPAEVRLELNTPLTIDPMSLALSPDGRTIAFVATEDGRSRLWLRPMDSPAARALAGTDGASFPFWSPDGASMGFFADGKLKRIDIDGAARVLAEAPRGRGGAWNRDGVILFTPGSPGPIYRVGSTGGDPAIVTRPDLTHVLGDRFPQFLPDGRQFLYYVQGTPEVRGVYAGRIEGSETRRLLDADAAAVFASGRLFFLRQGMLFAQDFDPELLEFAGNPVPVASQVMVDSSIYLGAFSASQETIVYRSGNNAGQRQFVWYDRSGKLLETAGDPDSAGPLNPAISPDGRRVALHRNVSANMDVWILDTARGVLSRFTFDPANDSFPIWSPDGTEIAFSSRRTGNQNIYRKRVTGASPEEVLLVNTQTKLLSDWSRDGRYLLFDAREASGDGAENLLPYDIWALPLHGDGKPFPVTGSAFDERWGQFSPDGKWIAYESNESGQPEIYLQPFPEPGGKWQVSTSGGVQARWSRDGRELFYLAPDGRLMAVPIHLDSSAPSVESGAPATLFMTRLGYAVQNSFRQSYMVSADAQRFLMHTPVEETAASPIQVILNWKPPGK